MKIIEGMKKLKDLQKKAGDIRDKVSLNCAISSIQSPIYDNQSNKISEWLQAHQDIMKEILKLRIDIQKTNLVTEVTIELGDKQVTKTIAEWIHRRRDLADYDKKLFRGLTDRGIREGNGNTPTGDVIDIKIIRYYSPEQRDAKISLYDSEPSLIDAKLEVINAITDLVE